MCEGDTLPFEEYKKEEYPLHRFYSVSLTSTLHPYMKSGKERVREGGRGRERKGGREGGEG